MLDVARSSRAGAGRCRLDQPRLAGAPARIAELAGEPLLKGLRPIAAGHRRHFLDPASAVQPGLAAMARHGLRFDALLKPRHLPVIGELAQRHPDLAVVIDHAAKPDIANAASSPGRATWRGWPRNAVVLQAVGPRHEARATGRSTIYIPTSITARDVRA